MLEYIPEYTTNNLYGHVTLSAKYHIDHVAHTFQGIAPTDK